MPKVFISYRQIDDAQRKRVRALAEQIRARGIEVTFDQFYKDAHAGGPPEGWPKWSRDQAISAPRVLIIGNTPWFRCFEGTEEPDVGLGAACEARNLFQRLYDIAGKNEIMRVVYFDDADVANISHDLKGYDRFHFERHFEDIIRWLLDISAIHNAPPRSDAKPSNIPFLSLGDLFKGRVDDIQKLHDALHSGARAAGISTAPAIAATHGLGGIGKTRLAVEYAWHHAADYDALLFISGETKEKIETTFAALTGELILDLPEHKLADPAAQKNAVIKWLRAHPRYLLIIDNIDDAEALKAARALINELPGGHIICTGRISN